VLWYHTPYIKDEHGKSTPRSFAYPDQAPDLEVPDGMQYVWSFFERVTETMVYSRFSDHGCNRIPITEWEAWARLVDVELRPQEWSIVFAMDAKYCQLRNELIAAEQSKASK